MSGAPVRKTYVRGTQRIVSPAETLARILPMTPAMGITRVADVTGLDSIGIPVVMVCRPNARSVSVAQGKGVDLDAARASGVMESIEQWHAEHIVRPLLFMNAAELISSGRRPVALGELPRLSWGSFNDRRKIAWIEGRTLASDEPRWVPLEVVHTDYSLPLPPGSGSFLISSNGLASGNHWLEAALHGLYEVVERDAVALWRAAGGGTRGTTRVDLASVDDSTCRELLAKYDRAGVGVLVWEATRDIGLPVFVAEIVDLDPDPGRVLYASGGQGCHRARGVALARALTEAAQSRLTYISGARDDIDRSAYQAARSPEQIATALAEYYDGESRSDLRRFAEAPDPPSESLEEDLEAVLDALARAGLSEAVAVDLTRPEFELPVVRVVVPGLESMCDAPGYLPGRRARALGST